MKTKPRVPDEPEPKWKQAGWPFKPRNSYERKLLKEGKPPPRGIYKQKCRSCGSTDREFYYRNYRGRKVRGTRCAPCRKKSRERWKKRNPKKAEEHQRKSNERARKLPPPNTEGPTIITSRQYHLGTGEVHERITKGEVFVITTFGEAARLLLPPQALYDLPKKWREGWKG